MLATGATDVGSIKASLILETKAFREGTERAKKDLGEVAENAKKASGDMKGLAESMKKTAESQEEIGKLTKSIEVLNGRIEAQEKVLADLKRQYDETFNDVKKSKLGEQITSAEDALSNMIDTSDKTAKKINELEDSLEDTAVKFDMFGDSAKSSVGKLGLAFGALSAAMTVAIKKAVDTAATFESSMAKVKAISGATASEFKLLEDQAISLGATTVFTASQAADAQSFLAMA